MRTDEYRTDRCTKTLGEAEADRIAVLADAAHRLIGGDAGVHEARAVQVHLQVVFDAQLV